MTGNIAAADYETQSASGTSCTKKLFYLHYYEDMRFKMALSRECWRQHANTNQAQKWTKELCPRCALGTLKIIPLNNIIKCKNSMSKFNENFDDIKADENQRECPQADKKEWAGASKFNFPVNNSNKPVNNKRKRWESRAYSCCRRFVVVIMNMESCSLWWAARSCWV